MSLFVVAVGVVWTVVAGAWLAARLNGEQLGVAGQQAVEALIALPQHWSDPAAAWPEPARSRLPGPWRYWPATAAAGVPVVVGGVWWLRRDRRRLGLERRVRLGVDAEARLATVADLAPILVNGPEPGRLILGRVHGRLVATENPAPRPTTAAEKRGGYRPSRGAVLVVGPSQSGKSSLLVPAILDWHGPVLASSVKVDLIDETFGHRATIGACKVYDPCRVTGLTPAAWSPLRGAYDWGGAQKAAHAVRACAPVSTGPNASFWDTQMEQLLSGVFWVAAHFGASMRDVCRWIATEDSPTDIGPGEIMALLDEALTSDDVDVSTDAGYAHETLEGIWRMQERTRADVYATARGAVWPWSNRDVAGTANGCEITLDWLLDSTDGSANTLYVAAPVDDTDRLRPAIGGLIADVLSQVMLRYTQTGQPLDPPLLVVLDEAGNTPLRDLPRLVSTLSGMGVQVVTVWQSVAQIHDAYRTAAGTVIANHRTKVFFSGISDGVTGELTNKLVGNEQVMSRQLSSDLGSWESGRRSLQESLITTGLIPAHVLREQAPGSALLIHGTIPPAHLTVRSQFSEPDLLRKASLPVPRHHTTTPAATATAAASSAQRRDDAATPSETAAGVVRPRVEPKRSRVRVIRGDQ